MPQSFAIQSVAIPLSGTDYFARDLSGQGGITTAQLVDRIVSLGANDVRLISSFGQLANVTSNTYTPYETQSVASLKVLADAAHARGLGVTWNPITHFVGVIAGDNTQDSHMRPSNPTEWFANYRTVVLDNARIAEAIGAERYQVFSDIEQFALARNPQLTDSMVALLGEVRQIYHGQLTSNIWTPDGTLAGFPIQILKALDLVGIALFPTLTKSSTPTLAELEAAFHNDPFGNDIIGNLKRAQAALDKPIWLADFAHSSYDGWLRNNPEKFDSKVTFVPDNSEQVLGYQAFMNTLLKYGGDWFKGLSVQNISRIDNYPAGSVPAYYSGPAAETFWGKPGEQVLRDYFNGAVQVGAIELKGTDYGETVKVESQGPATLRAGRGAQTLIGGSQDDALIAARPAQSVPVHELKIVASGNLAQGELPTFIVRVNGEPLPTQFTVGSKYGDPLVSQTIRIYGSDPIRSIQITATNYRSEASDGFRSIDFQSITLDGVDLAKVGTYTPSFGAQRAFAGGMSSGGSVLFDTSGLSLQAPSSASLPANTVMDGGAGADVAIYEGSHSEHVLMRLTNGWSVTKPGASAGTGTDRLVNVEVIQFSDRSMLIAENLDLSNASASQTVDLGLGKISTVTIGGVSRTLISAVDGGEVHGGAAADTLRGGGSASRLFGGGGADSINGGGASSNFLRGEAGDDSLSGGSGFDDMHGNMGNDTVRGNDGDDWVVGGKDNDLLFGDAGFDVVYGNMGNDTVDGGAGNDWVRGGQGDDTVMGGSGDDWIWGDRGNDSISGGAGADLFHASSGAGIDRITDFSYAEGDRLKLEGNPSRTVAQAGADVVIDMGNGDQVILVGVTLASLGSGWIL